MGKGKKEGRRQKKQKAEGRKQKEESGKQRGEKAEARNRKRGNGRKAEVKGALDRVASCDQRSRSVS